MNQSQYLADQEVGHFRNWLTERLQGQPIALAKYPNLLSAKEEYTWPLKRLNGLPKATHPYAFPVLPTLPARSSLESNQVVLRHLQNELRCSYRDAQIDQQGAQRLAGVVAAIFYWGGVFTRTRNGGNKPWLEQNAHRLRATLSAVIADMVSGEDRSQITDLRFNSGMTKVYSLLVDDFVIYDSRVAASLAWLVRHWWCDDQRMAESALPSLLRFGCLAGNGIAESRRRPSPVFPMLRNDPHGHYRWNIRTNWLLNDALIAAGENTDFRSLREVEAALFQMGDDLQ